MSVVCEWLQFLLSNYFFSSHIKFQANNVLRLLLLPLLIAFEKLKYILYCICNFNLRSYHKKSAINILNISNIRTDITTHTQSNSGLLTGVVLKIIYKKNKYNLLTYTT